MVRIAAVVCCAAKPAMLWVRCAGMVGYRAAIMMTVRYARNGLCAPCCAWGCSGLHAAMQRSQQWSDVHGLALRACTR